MTKGTKPRRLRAMRHALLVATGLGAATTLFAAPPTDTPAQGQPNIVLILADDLGFSDLGAFGGEIATPNLDRLATAGLRFSDFQAMPACSPTRAALLTGADPHLVGMGTFSELEQASQKGRPGYEGHLNDRAQSIATILHDSGYFTAISGKWHLGYGPDADPSRHGFDRSFILIGGGGDHFGPRFGTVSGGADTMFRENGQPVARLPADFYSSDYYTTRLIDYLATPEARDKPFFAMLSFQAPHWPLQAPPESIAKYRGRYDQGWDQLRTARLARLRQLGLIQPNLPASAMTPDPDAWRKLSKDEKRLAARRMEIYAGMVDRMDENVGRLIASLKRSGQYDNTIFVFLSDNGAEGWELDKADRPANAQAGKQILAQADNSPDNMGKTNSRIWYGPYWAQAATAPYRLFKQYPTFGGTHVPAFITMPGTVGQRGVSNVFVNIFDLAPTLADWAGAGPVRAAPGKAPFTGTSLVPLLKGTVSSVHGNRCFLTELWGWGGVRCGNWKAVRVLDRTGQGKWTLFDLAVDPAETTDVSGKHPDIADKLATEWQAYSRRVGVVAGDESGL